jgi:hypothetical protein
MPLEERSGATMPVDRSMTPASKFGPMPVRSAIEMTFVELWFEAIRRAVMIAPVELVIEPGTRAMKITPGVAAWIVLADTMTVNIPMSGWIKFFKTAASIRTACAALFALGPGITVQGHNDANQYNADDDLFLHGLPPCFQD